MGYAQLFSLEEHLIRDEQGALPTGAVWEELADAVLTLAQGGEEVDPRVRSLGSHHSSAGLGLLVDAHEVDAVGLDREGLAQLRERDSSQGSWVGSLGPSMHVRVARELEVSGRIPRLGRAALLGGGGSTRGVRSFFQLYQDALGWGVDLPELAAGLERLARTHLEDSVGLGRHANALSKIGTIEDEATVGLVWWGNRLWQAREMSELCSAETYARFSSALR